MVKLQDNTINQILDEITHRTISPLDLLPHTDLSEKLIELTLHGDPRSADFKTNELLNDLRFAIESKRVDDAKVVVFGGGSGLSNIIGGDSRSEFWIRNPFCGLKEVFPHTKSIVCITDDGGSTGELLKDLPIIAIGDIRHVLLSSIQLKKLQKSYQLSVDEAKRVASILYKLFNSRFDQVPSSLKKLIKDCDCKLQSLPEALLSHLMKLLSHIYEDSRFTNSFKRSHCLGNLLLVSSIYINIPKKYNNRSLADENEIVSDALLVGLHGLIDVLGVNQNGVMPCSSTPAQLRLQYSNGVQIRGESKSGNAVRGFPVETVAVDYCGTPKIYDEVIESIEHADILIMAPGSLYSSIIPILQVPVIADAIRRNSKAHKILISNLWVQSGETDLSMADPGRKFRVSDMLQAYEKNIPGGIVELFRDVLCLSLKDVPASVLQKYAVEGKIPIYLDKRVVHEKGYHAIECGIYSHKALSERGVIQHDPNFLAKVIKTLYVTKQDTGCENVETATLLAPPITIKNTGGSTGSIMPSVKYFKIEELINKLTLDFREEGDYCLYKNELKKTLISIVWKHHDIPLSHLDFFVGIQSVSVTEWCRDQQWDNVFSFFDPSDRLIKIREDQFLDADKLEVAFLIALGESLLGTYALSKSTKIVEDEDVLLGKVYYLRLAEKHRWNSFFAYEELIYYLELSRMVPTGDGITFTRLINAKEGFTPPGLLLGLLYVWYLDNRLANYLEYKMSILKIIKSPLIPEQLKMCTRREKIIKFFREVVFA